MEISLLMGAWRHESLGRVETLELDRAQLVSRVEGPGIDRESGRLEKPVLDIFAPEEGLLRVLSGPDPRMMNPYENIDIFELDGRVMLARMDGHQFLSAEHARRRSPSDRALAKFYLREESWRALAPAPRMLRQELLDRLEALRERVGQDYAQGRLRLGARVALFDDLLRLDALDRGIDPFSQARAFYLCLADNLEHPAVREAHLRVKNAIG